MKLTPKKDEFDNWGFIDEDGDWAVHPLFDSVEPFRGKYAKGVKNGKRCYIDEEGNWFDEIPFFDKEEYEASTATRSPMEILDDGFSKISGILHKGLHDL